MGRQSQWQFFIVYSSFWLVDILLRKLDTSSNENDKNSIFFNEKQQKNAKKVYVNIN